MGRKTAKQEREREGGEIERRRRKVGGGREAEREIEGKEKVREEGQKKNIQRMMYFL